MIQRVLWHLAGVDRETLATCPATDKVWATHLGFSLLLSFTVVLGISFHATGYVIADVWMRLTAAAVVALTVFMFDRALYQSDWFCQGILRRRDHSTDVTQRDRLQSLRRFVRIAIRLTISFGLAWIIAVFLELAIFSDTINERTKRDHLVGNGPIYQKIDSYEAQLGREIEQRRQNLATADELYRRELSAAPLPEPGVPAQLDRLEQQIRDLDGQEQELRSELRQIQQKVTSYTEEMNAEELGRKLTQNNSGRPGTGPRYQFAKQQREVYATQGADRERELRQLEAKRSDLRSAQARLLADAAARATQVRDTVQNKRDELKLQVEVARNELALLEGSRLARISEFRQQALSASDFQKQKDDPLSRMTAYQELKNDPKDGATITLFSWMTKFLVIFLEIVPVVAKMFFSPPSVYAARLQAEVEGGREAARIRVELEGDRKVATVRDEIESEREAAEISVLSERERATAKVELKLLGERPAATARADGEHEGAISLAADERERTVAKLRTEAAHQPPAVRPEMETKRGDASSFATSPRARAGRVNPL